MDVADIEVHIVENPAAGRVACIATRRPPDGPTLRYPIGQVRRAVTRLPADIRILAFVSSLDRDAAAKVEFERVLAAFDEGDAVAVIACAPVTEAMKRVERDVVVEGVDRSTLVSAGSLEIVDRRAFERVVATMEPAAWINPARTMQVAGGAVLRSEAVD